MQKKGVMHSPSLKTSTVSHLIKLAFKNTQIEVETHKCKNKHERGSRSSPPNKRKKRGKKEKYTKSSKLCFLHDITSTFVYIHFEAYPE